MESSVLYFSAQAVAFHEDGRSLPRGPAHALCQLPGARREGAGHGKPGAPHGGLEELHVEHAAKAPSQLDGERQKASRMRVQDAARLGTGLVDGDMHGGLAGERGPRQQGAVRLRQSGVAVFHVSLGDAGGGDQHQVLPQPQAQISVEAGHGAGKPGLAAAVLHQVQTAHKAGDIDAGLVKQGVNPAEARLPRLEARPIDLRHASAPSHARAKWSKPPLPSMRSLLQ